MTAVPCSVDKEERDSEAEYADDEFDGCAQDRCGLCRVHRVDVVWKGPVGSEVDLAPVCWVA